MMGSRFRKVTFFSLTNAEKDREEDLPSSDSQSCWDEGREGSARALYSNTTELEMI